MRIQLTEQRTFTATAGGEVITGLRLASEWEGLRKLQNDAGDSLIVDGDVVLKASPNFLAAYLDLDKGDRFVNVPETKLPDGSIVPAFKVGQFITGQANGKLAINAAARPWVNINYRDTVAACKAAGYGLITERQWLAIGSNAASVDDNWTEGKVGQGSLFQGIRLGDVSKAQPGTFEPANRTEHRWLQLPNDEQICDLNGNAFQWVYDDVQGDDEGLVKEGPAADSLSLQAPYPPLEKGMGWRPTRACGWSGYALIRGGCWDSDSSAGVFYLYGGWPDHASDYVGFRCTKPGR